MAHQIDFTTGQAAIAYGRDGLTQAPFHYSIKAREPCANGFRHVGLVRDI